MAFVLGLEHSNMPNLGKIFENFEIVRTDTDLGSTDSQAEIDIRIILN